MLDIGTSVLVTSESDRRLVGSVRSRLGVVHVADLWSGRLRISIDSCGVAPLVELLRLQQIVAASILARSDVSHQ